MSDEKPVPATLESIAQQIRELTARFDGVDQRFDGVDHRFDGIDQRFDDINQRFDGIDRRLDGMDQRFDGIDRRLGGMDQRFDAIDQRFDDLSAQLRIEIEAVRGDVRLVAEAFGAQSERSERNDADHEAFRKALEEHDVRLLALEKGRASAPDAG